MTTQFVVNHLWQSSCFVLLAALLAFLLRSNSPKIRYWVWLSASLKFLIPFALLVSLGSVVPRPARRSVSLPAPVFPTAVIEVAEPFSPAHDAIVPVHSSSGWGAVAIGAVWSLGFLAVVLLRCRGWRRVRATVREGTPIDLPIAIPVLATPGVAEPGVVGFVRPVLVLPAQLLQQLNPQQLDAILVHELCHVRRRDNFFAAVHMVVEAIFWFHPLVWWVGSRMVKERELACDEEVLRMGCEPTDYVEGILKVCRLYTQSPLPCVSGVTGADVKRRLRVILAGSIARELNVGKKAMLAAIALAALALPILSGVVNAPVIVAQVPAAGRVPSSPVQATTPESKPLPSQPPAAVASPAPASPVRTIPSATASSPAPPSQLVTTPTFDVASIRPCKPDTMSAGGRGGPAPTDSFRMTCRNLRNLIEDAYIRFADGKIRQPILSGLTKIEGAPGWMNSEQYTIEAKSENAQPIAMRAGPMMQALLEDRFQLRVHRETREGSIYELKIARGGSKIQPVRNGPCLASDFAGVPLPPGFSLPTDDERQCSMVFNGRQGPNAVLVARSSSMENFAAVLTGITGQLVIDKTGITGSIDYRLVYFPEGGIPIGADAADADDAPASSIYTVLQQEMGLKLERARGPREYLVIDHIERPSEN
jgi:uncharacterized protein (TIGR03435 family)